MKNVLEYREATYENYLAYHGTTKTATLKNITVNGHAAQQMDFYKSVHPDGTTMYYVAIVFRGRYDNYYKKSTWLEDRYVVTKNEGNAIYTTAMTNKAYSNDAITTY